MHPGPQALENGGESKGEAIKLFVAVGTVDERTPTETWLRDQCMSFVLAVVFQYFTRGRRLVHPSVKTALRP